MAAMVRLDTSHPVPAEALSAHVGVFGKTGSGKSYAARGLVERLLREQRRVVIVDPTGVWWGLRASADGKAEGFPVAIFGGDHADVPLTEGSGSKLGALLAERPINAIVDVSEFSNNGQRAFMDGFLGELYRLNKRPLHLVIDEADAFAPQNPLPETRRLLGHVSQIVRRGRVKGFRVMMITQRPATIHKDVITQVNALIAKRVTAPQDRKAIEDWVKGQADADAGKEVLDSLARMEREEGWIWAPEADFLKRAKFPRITTFDSMRAPDDGEAFEPETLADVDVDALREAFAGDAEPDPAPSRQIDLAPIKKAARDEGYRAGFADGLSAGLRQAGDAIESLKGAESAPEPKPALAPVTHTTEPSPPPKRESRPPAAPPSGEEWVEAARNVWPALLTWAQIGAILGKKARGGHFWTMKKALLESGAVREDGDKVVLASPPSLPPGKSPAELLSERLPEPSRKMYIALRKRPMTQAQLGAALDMKPTGGHWWTGLALLRSTALIRESGGVLSANPDLERR